MHAENNVHANFHCRVSAAWTFCYKIVCVAQVSLENWPIFVCNQDIRARTMGCKRGLDVMVYVNGRIIFVYIKCLIHQIFERLPSYFEIHLTKTASGCYFNSYVDLHKYKVLITVWMMANLWRLMLIGRKGQLKMATCDIDGGFKVAQNKYLQHQTQMVHCMTCIFVV